LDRFRAHVRRELIFLALGTMDVCVITPLFAALLSPIIPVRPLLVMAVFIGAVLAVHYLARLALWLPFRSALRSGLLGLGMLLSGLLTIHQLLHAQTRLLDPTWLVGVFGNLQQANLSHEDLSHDVIVFLLVLFLWWRGLVLAQRRLDSESVTFRFRLGLMLLAITTVLGGTILPWPHYHFVFVFFFASLLGIALARAEEVGQRYGSSQSPFGLGWLVTLVTTSLTVLLLAAGVAALLTGENLGLFVTPALEVLRMVFTGVAYVLAWVAHIVVTLLLAVLHFFFGEINLEEIRRRLALLLLPEPQVQPRQLPFTAEQLALVRTVGVILGVLLLLLLVAISLRRLRARAGQRRDEERESVWEGAHLRRRLRDLLRHGRRRLGQATAGLSSVLLGRLFAAWTVRRIYAHMGALAAEQGYPRAAYETPYEYLPALEQAFPGSRDEVMWITEAYVAVHYGEVPELPEDLATVQAAWDCIRGCEA